jgi:hypothetical protein
MDFTGVEPGVRVRAELRESENAGAYLREQHGIAVGRRNGEEVTFRHFIQVRYALKAIVHILNLRDREAGTVGHLTLSRCEHPVGLHSLDKRCRIRHPAEHHLC